MKLLSTVGASATLAFSIASSLFGAQQPATALPGQTFQQVQQTVRSSRLFQGMSLTEESRGYYTVSSPFDGGDAVLYVIGEGNTVSTETLQFRYPDSRISFERESGSSTSLIADIWGDGIAQDYVDSRYTDEIQGGIGPNHYYLGERYGYRRSIYNDTRTGTGIYSFTVMDIVDWEEFRRADRVCSANPNAFQCSGL